MHTSTILALFTAALAPMAVLSAPEPMPKHKPHHTGHLPPYPSGTGTGYFPTATTGVFPTATGYYYKGKGRHSH